MPLVPLRDKLRFLNESATWETQRAFTVDGKKLGF